MFSKRERKKKQKETTCFYKSIFVNSKIIKRTQSLLLVPMYAVQGCLRPSFRFSVESDNMFQPLLWQSPGQRKQYNNKKETDSFVLFFFRCEVCCYAEFHSDIYLIAKRGKKKREEKEKKFFCFFFLLFFFYIFLFSFLLELKHRLVNIIQYNLYMLLLFIIYIYIYI